MGKIIGFLAVFMVAILGAIILSILGFTKAADIILACLAILFFLILIAFVSFIPTLFLKFANSELTDEELEEIEINFFNQSMPFSDF